MKGKVAFVLGAAVGYVLGARAGRARYEKIKSGAKAAWESDPVQNGVSIVQDAATAKFEEVKAAALSAGKDALSTVIGSAKGAANSVNSTSDSTGAQSGSTGKSGSTGQQSKRDEK
ncbi:hypothetical protein K8P10_000093 [Leucobacter sp. Psy1]|uniref:YtxH domain-containing protein n=1 Tax=Leucobacter sp. Psy1 TaxID=2875729 RepID=UPI001CD49AD9|nr:YtxH domain-containing protein [Leucobacter sp. Psy1]UBH04582.1 hypothetical protein K8P10_000093 [Leucobacter sp. Psy1]